MTDEPNGLDEQPRPKRPKTPGSGRQLGTPNKPRGPFTGHLRVERLRADALRVLSELACYGRDEAVRFHAARALEEATRAERKPAAKT
jgi:hypothetical protein